MCVEVNADFSFPSSINVSVFDEEKAENLVVPVMVEYQSKPPSCPVCKVFGHSPLKCPKASFKWVPKGTSEKGSGDKHQVVDASPAPKATSDSHATEQRLGNLVDTPVDGDHNWITIHRGAKSQLKGTAGQSPNVLAINSFSPIGQDNDVTMGCSDNDSPIASNPLVDRLIVVDEKEGKDLKQKSRVDRDSLQAAKRRNKGKGGKSPH